MSEPMDSSLLCVSSERPSQVFRHKTYPPNRTSRAMDLADPGMRTIDERFSEPPLMKTFTVRFAPTCNVKKDADSAVMHLHDAIHPSADKDRLNGSRARRLSITTLVIDLALAVRRKVSNLRLTRA